MMNEVSRTIATVKRQLKARGLTYRDVASALGLSEASIKRVFARESFTVERLAQIAHLLGFTLAELLAESASEVPKLSVLTSEQEARLVGDEKMLLVAVCALNRWTAAEISSEYRLTRAEVVKHLLVLDRMGVIELLPGDRIRPLVARDFDWLPDGPIRRYFMDRALADFLASHFGEANETLEFAQGLVTESGLAQLRQELRRLRARMAALHEESTAAPLEQRRGIGLMLALRRWEPESFKRVRRTPGVQPRTAPQRKIRFRTR
jgi:transcriptional regulator with XRE-family HTH domain